MIITHEYPVCEYDTARDPIIHPTDFLDKCLPKKCIITFFRKELETSFIDYLVTYRIERAQQMLLHSNLDLKTISEKTGFHGYNYFLRTYKEKTGHTPSYDLKNYNI